MAGAVFGGVAGWRGGTWGLAGLVQYGRVLLLNGAEGAGTLCDAVGLARTILDHTG